MVVALAVTLLREVGHLTQPLGPGTGAGRPGFPIESLWVWVRLQSWAVLLTPILSAVSAGPLCLTQDCVPWAEPGPGREQMPNKYVLDPRMSPDTCTALYKTPSYLLSHLI